ncbi:unnamed protein product [Polarella glacialis]|uniref:Uncharacterized protein n=1 Tax=Polarella glacialis TaxID=89957 RepID=A0A813IB29_POLGL|nr:unnamed protein product [Polarella glacialis]
MSVCLVLLLASACSHAAVAVDSPNSSQPGEQSPETTEANSSASVDAANLTTASGNLNESETMGSLSNLASSQWANSGPSDKQWWCAAASQQCRQHNWMIWQQGLPCCDGMKCQFSSGGSNPVCVSAQPRCVAEHGVCGGPGQSNQNCCGSMQCQRLLGGSQMQCVSKQPECVAEHGVCGGPGQLTQTCCGNTECQRLLGGSQMQCVSKQPERVAEHGVCGGPGQLTQTCCGNTECQRLLGGSQMQCVPRQPECKAEHAICGGPGQLTQTCCGNMQCKQVRGGSQMQCMHWAGMTSALRGSRAPESVDAANLTTASGNLNESETMGSLSNLASSQLANSGPSDKQWWCAAASQQCRQHNWMIWQQGLPCCDGMKCQFSSGGSNPVCVSAQPQCVAEHGVCGGPGQSNQNCCGSMQCQRLLGGSQMQCVSKQPERVAEHGVCGGPGQLTQTCCGNMECQRLLGGSQMQCVPRQPECKAEHAICGGPGQLTQTCCGNMHCQRLMGGSQMQCIS